MKKLLYFSILPLFLGMYYIYFRIVGDGFTKADLGPLGDFIGGNLNPILTCISTILLIETVVIQRETVKDSKLSEIESRKTIQEQSDIAAKQSFESSLFNIINLCLNEYKNTSIELKSGDYTGNKAFAKYLELYETLEKQSDRTALLKKLEELSCDALFDNLKTFAMAFKVINEYAPVKEKENYISITLTMIPMSLLQLLCIAMLHSSWPILESFEKSRIFERASIKKMMNHYA